ncbi:retrovirus-related pol polyprotein from transposon TNT 1-94 [Tanacetum coccineum]
MIIKNSISVAIRGAILDSENEKQYLSSIEEQFKGTSKAHASTLILKMLTTKYDGASGVQEERLKVEKPDVVHVATTNSNNRKGSWKGKGLRGDNSTPNKVQKKDASTSSFQGGPKCKFCHKKGHIQKDCPKFKKWLAKKADVENQLDRKIKLVRSDRGGEYYGRLTDVGQAPGSFFDFCNDHVIINQYTITRIVKTRHLEFLENANNSGSGSFRRIELQEARDETPIIRVPIPINTPIDTSNDHSIAQDHPNTLEENKPNPKINVEPQETQQSLRSDPESFGNAITYDQSTHWREAMEDDLNSISKNNVWELSELLKGAKPVGCKWVFKTKLDPNGNIERYKTRLVAKGYTQKEGVDYKETFSPVSRKDSLRIVMAFVAHFDLELRQMDVKTSFLNGDLHEDVYMSQPQGFKSKCQEHLVCKLKKSIYGLKQASRQWYLKFDEVMKKHNFIKNQSKRFLSRNFDIKDLGEASYVIGIEIHRDQANRKLGLSQKVYIECVLNRFQSNAAQLHWKAAKKVLRYLQRTKEYQLTYTRSDNLEVIGYSDSDFAKCKDTGISTLGYIFMLSGGPSSWKSKKQRNLITGLKIINSISRPLKIYCDNSATVSFSNSNSSTRAGLYLETKYLFVRERVEEQRICIEHIRTHEMLADSLTKGLPPKVFQGHVAKIGFRQDLT